MSCGIATLVIRLKDKRLSRRVYTKFQLGAG
jgi:hypothetical protein